MVADGLEALWVEGVPTRHLPGALSLYGVGSGVPFEAQLTDPRTPWRITDRSLDPPTERPSDQTVSWNGFQTQVITEIIPLALVEAPP